MIVFVIRESWCYSDCELDWLGPFVDVTSAVRAVLEECGEWVVRSGRPTTQETTEADAEWKPRFEAALDRSFATADDANPFLAGKEWKHRLGTYDHYTVVSWVGVAPRKIEKSDVMGRLWPKDA